VPATPAAVALAGVVGPARIRPEIVGAVERTLLPLPVRALKPIYSKSQEAAVVPELRIFVILILEPGSTVAIKLLPDELTVKLPVLLFSIT
jgi:hypothetical protein